MISLRFAVPVPGLPTMRTSLAGIVTKGRHKRETFHDWMISQRNKDRMKEEKITTMNANNKQGKK